MGGCPIAHRAQPLPLPRSKAGTLRASARVPVGHPPVDVVLPLLGGGAPGGAAGARAWRVEETVL